MAILGLNHAVLYVRDARRSSRFYMDVLGFVPVIEDAAGRFAFLRAPASVNHHDIAFFSIGAGAGDSTAGKSTVGMYHIAWAVPTIDELMSMREKLIAAGAYGGESDHGVNKSVYAKDPDGLEFEVTYVVRPEYWGGDEHEAIIRSLDLDAELARFAGVVSHVGSARP
ncbi:MAG TPA: VOC family protein [Acidimicrobiales bacterium]|nr:VOC family protein [Acidimicrobiales bacterium]